MADQCKADHCVTVKYHNPKPFVYDEEPDGINDPNKQRAKHRDTISWMSPDGDITISFPNGNPIHGKPPHITASRGKWTTPAILDGSAGEPAGTAYKYDVTINGVTDDPMIIFDDHGLNTDGRAILIGVDDLNTITASAKDAWDEVFKQLNTAGGIKAEATRLFFPNGINDIEVDIEFGGATVKITVKGP